MSDDGGADPRAVIEDHLELRRMRRLEDDLARNYAADVVVLSRTGVRHGHDGMRQSAAELEHYLPDADFAYDELLVAGEFGYLEWRGYGTGGRRVCDGADAYVVRGGRIVAQTIHYLVHDSDGGARGT